MTLVFEFEDSALDSEREQITQDVLSTVREIYHQMSGDDLNVTPRS